MSSTPHAHGVTELLTEWSNGDRGALEKLVPLVYSELKKLARVYLSRERREHTLQATALVNEAYLRLVNQRDVEWQGRAHFFGIAAQVMRRILVDHARSRGAAKRGGDKLPLEEGAAAVPPPDVELLALDEALTRLEALDPQQSRVVEYRFFGGLGIEETAKLLNVSPATVKREWAMAKAWLHREIRGRSDA